MYRYKYTSTTIYTCTTKVLVLILLLNHEINTNVEVVLSRKQHLCFSSDQPDIDPKHSTNHYVVSFSGTNIKVFSQNVLTLEDNSSFYNK